MSNPQTAKNIELVKKYFSSIQTGDLETLGALVAKDVVWYQPGENIFSGTHIGAEAVFGMIGGMMEVSGGSFKIDNVHTVMAHGSKVAASVRFSGERDGISMAMNGVDILTIKDGQISEAWLYSEDQAAEDAFWGK